MTILNSASLTPAPEQNNQNNYEVVIADALAQHPYFATEVPYCTNGVCYIRADPRFAPSQ